MQRQPLKAGCQTFTWEMLGNAWRGDPDDLLAAIKRANYTGIEITDKMIGRYKGKPDAFRNALARHDLTLVAYACGSDSGFTEPDALEADLQAAGEAIALASAFPGAHVSLGSATRTSEGPRAQKFAFAAHFYNAVGERGVRANVPVAVHPSSHHNTLLLTRIDYDDIFALLDPALVGWVPDTGHILRGGQDILDTLTTFRDRICYLHLKDVDANGAWQMLGAGVCDITAVVGIVRTAPAFNGWLVLEEESEEARRDPAAAVAKNRHTLSQLGILV